MCISVLIISFLLFAESVSVAMPQSQVYTSECSMQLTDVDITEESNTLADYSTSDDDSSCCNIIDSRTEMSIDEVSDNIFC